MKTLNQIERQMNEIDKLKYIKVLTDKLNPDYKYMTERDLLIVTLERVSRLEGASWLQN